MEQIIKNIKEKELSYTCYGNSIYNNNNNRCPKLYEFGYRLGNRIHVRNISFWDIFVMHSL